MMKKSIWIIPMPQRKSTAKASMGLKEIIQLMMVMIIIVVLTAVLTNVIDTMIGEESTASENNMLELGKQIEKMEADDTKNMPIFIEEKKFVIGFNMQVDKLDLSSCGISISVAKPFKCQNNPCICLCETDKKKGCKEEICYLLDDKLKLRGGTQCPYLFVNGNKDPQTVYLHKLQDEARVCSTKC